VTSRRRYEKLQLNVLANSNEKFMTIQFGPVCFLDSFKFNSTSLDGWIKSQRRRHEDPKVCFPAMLRHHPFLHRRNDKSSVEERLDLLLRKVPMAYRSIVDESYFDLPPVLPIEAYDDDLRNVECSAEDYELVNRVVQQFELYTQEEYHMLYLATDVLTLADCFSSMRQAWKRQCGLDLCHNITMPSASYLAMLKSTKAELELITDRELMEAINHNIRGGVSCIFQPHSKANNWKCLPATLPPELEQYAKLHQRVRSGNKLFLWPEDYQSWCKSCGYDVEKPTTWIAYIDANSLYPTVMTMALPHDSFVAEALPPSSEASMEYLQDLLSLYNNDQETASSSRWTTSCPRSSTTTSTTLQ
jgi:hypothetical protein